MHIYYYIFIRCVMRISHSLSSSRGGEGAVALVRGVGLAIGASWAGGQGGWWAGLGRCPRSGAVSAAWRAGWSGASVQGWRAGSSAPPPLGPARSSPSQASQPWPPAGQRPSPIHQRSSPRQRVGMPGLAAQPSSPQHFPP